MTFIRVHSINSLLNLDPQLPIFPNHVRYRSKKVRAQKVANLIHNCDVHKTIPKCSVDVHFETIIDRGEAFEVVPSKFFFIL